MAAATPFITKAQLRTRLSPVTYDLIFDDDKDGIGDDAVADQFIREAQSIIEAYVRPIYTLPFPTVPEVLVTLELDICTARAAQRFPEYVKSDGRALMKDSLAVLVMIRDGKLRLDNAASEPANSTLAPIPANVKGTYQLGTPEAPDGVGEGTFASGFADF